jgi:2-haloacid dehalogenase
MRLASYQVTIAAPVEVVWAHLTTAEVWSAGSALKPPPSPRRAECCAGCIPTAPPSSAGSWSWSPTGGSSSTYGWEDGRLGVAPGTTTVEIDLVEEAGATTLRLVHHGLPPETVPDHQQGWAYFLNNLRDTLSAGWDACGRSPACGRSFLLPTPQDGQATVVQTSEEVMMRRVQVFDVNETLLDLAAMDPHFQRIFGDAGVRVAWFNQMIQSALVATVTGAYRPFGDHAMAALEMTAEQAGVALGGDNKEAVAAQLRQLPAHPEVADGLQRLRDAGLRLAALTNSTEQVARAQLEHAGLLDAFDLVLSADTVRRLKPAPEPYRMAAERLGVTVGEVRLIAAHAWDVAGAARAGCATAFVARPGKVLDPLVERPEIIGADLAQVADAVLAVDSDSNRRP